MLATGNTHRLTFIIYYVPDTMLNAIYELSHLLLTMTLWDRNDYYFSFPYEKTKANNGQVKFKGTQKETELDFQLWLQKLSS